MPAGRPRIELDLKKEGYALLEWAMTDDALVLRSFPATRGYSYDTLLRWMEYQPDEEFCDCYNRALDLIGARREMLLIKNNSSSPFQRYAAFYDKALHKFERKDKKEDSDLKKSEINNAADLLVKTIDFASARNNPPS